MSGLIFIRHAETDLAGTFCGHADPPLNARGQAQVEALIAQLSSVPFDAICSSDLRRAEETAAALAQAFHVPCTTARGLREIGFGDWEGMSWAEVEHRDPVYAREWSDAFPQSPAPGGEHFAAFETRVLREIEPLLQADKRLAVVTHAGVMRLVLCKFLGQTQEQAWARTSEYCSFFEYAGAAASMEVSQ